jgi:hypothetical protein
MFTSDNLFWRDEKIIFNVAGMSLEKLFDMCRIYEITKYQLSVFLCLLFQASVSVLYVEKIIT